ncbi:conjugal transfer protein [Leuconostoc citreum]|uniref:conjugal transfer protein n=1 Tax=Leuconostoc citreum TaxID=33964 RepID=UPI0015DAA13D|nr:conjugal transfer protein [Leuconostoc citreum]
MFDKLKSIKKGYVKSRDKPDQSLPYAKVQKRGKSIRRFVKIALVLVGLSGAIAFIKASNVSQTNHKLIAKMKTYDDKLEKASMGQSVYSPSLNRYAQGFFQTYFTQSDNDDDKQKRLKALKMYFATNISSTIYDNQDSQKETYVSSKASDMSLIMKEPEGLEGQYAVKSIDQVNVSGSKDNMNIKYLLTLTDTETKLEHSEQITLTVLPKGSIYYVVKMIHTQGGLLN